MNLAIVINSLKIFKFKHQGILTQFAKVFPSKYTSKIISPKFHSTDILRLYTVVMQTPTCI